MDGRIKGGWRWEDCLTAVAQMAFFLLSCRVFVGESEGGRSLSLLSSSLFSSHNQLYGCFVENQSFTPLPPFPSHNGTIALHPSFFRSFWKRGYWNME